MKIKEFLLLLLASAAITNKAAAELLRSNKLSNATTEALSSSTEELHEALTNAQNITAEVEVQQHARELSRRHHKQNQTIYPGPGITIPENKVGIFKLPSPGKKVMIALGNTSPYFPTEITITSVNFIATYGNYHGQPKPTVTHSFGTLKPETLKIWADRNDMYITAPIPNSNQESIVADIPCVSGVPGAGCEITVYGAQVDIALPGRRLEESASKKTGSHTDAISKALARLKDLFNYNITKTGSPVVPIQTTTEQFEALLSKSKPGSKRLR